MGVTRPISEEARQVESARSAVSCEATPNRTVSPNDGVGIRADSERDAPEPALAAVVFEDELVGYAIGNDTNGRSIDDRADRPRAADAACAIPIDSIGGLHITERRSPLLEKRPRRTTDRPGPRVVRRFDPRCLRYRPTRRDNGGRRGSPRRAERPQKPSDRSTRDLYVSMGVIRSRATLSATRTRRGVLGIGSIAGRDRVRL